jgi:hypothetical protein
MKRKRCCECLEEGIENYDVDGFFHIITDSDTGETIRKGYVCFDHIEMLVDCEEYLIDGI